MNIAKQATQRLPWIDNAKFFAIWCVIFGHFNGTLLTQGRPFFSEVNLWIVVFNMPLFVLMSGYSNYAGLKRIENIKGLLSFFKKTVMRIALPCIIPSIMLYYIREDATKLDFKLFWFLVMLFVMQITAGSCFYLVKKLYPRHQDLLGYLLFIISMFALSKYSTGELCIYYAMGGVIRKLENKQVDFFMEDCKKKLRIGRLLLLSVVAFLIFPIVYNYQFYTETIGKLYSEGLLYIWFLRLICASLFCYIIIGVTKLLSSKYNFLSFIGSKTLGLYIYTSVLLDVCIRYHIRISDDSWYTWFVAIGFSIVVMFLALGIIRLLESNKYTNLLFLERNLK